MKNLTEIEILQNALETVKKDEQLPAIEAVQYAAINVSNDTRKNVMEALRQGSLRSRPGEGVEFQVNVILSAIEIAKNPDFISSITQQQVKVENESAISTEKIIIAKNVAKEVKQASTIVASQKTKKFVANEILKTVSEMSLKPTDTNKKATCAFQFSRHTNKEGIMDVFEGTEVQFIESRTVYENENSSKRMILRVRAGTNVRLNGKNIQLDSDIDVAAVANHVDPNDPYNIQVKNNEEKRKQKDELRDRASNVKTAVV